jgi:hypothetical protein
MYCVYIHEGDNAPSLHVFTGPNALIKEMTAACNVKGKIDKKVEKIIILILGQDYKTKIQASSRVKFHPIRINDDDNLLMVRGKIAEALEMKSQDIYMWCIREMIDKIGYWESIIDEWGYGRKSNLVTGVMLKSLLGSLCATIDIDVDDTAVFNLWEAKKLLIEKSKTTFVNIPLGFRLTQSNRQIFFPVHPGIGSTTHDIKDKVIIHDEGERHIEYFAPLDKAIHIIRRNSIINDVELYFPSTINHMPIQKIKDLVKEQNEDNAILENANANFNKANFIRYIQLRNLIGISFDDKNLSIDRLFNDVILSSPENLDSTYNILFAKKITKNNGTMIKVIRDLLVIPTFKNDLLKWVKLTVFKRNVFCDAIILKIDVKMEIPPVTLIMLANGTCDLKIRVGVNNADVQMDFAFIKKILIIVNSIIRDTSSKITLFDIDIFKKRSSETYTRITNLTIDNSIKSIDKVPQLAQIQGAISGSSAFAYIGTKNGLIDIVYKKVNDYGCEFQVNSYIARHSSLKESVVKDNIMTLFGLSKSEADLYWLEWRTKYSQEYSKLGIGRGKTTSSTMSSKMSLQLVRIKLKASGIGYRIICDGMVDSRYNDRIINLLIIAFDKAKKSKKIKQITTNYLDIADAVDDDDVFDDDDFDNMSDGDDINADDLDMYFKDDGDDDDEVDLVDNLNDRTAINRYILNNLKKADRVLFSIDGDGEKYARLCQKHEMRQPIVVSKEEKENIDKEAPGSYKNAFNYRDNFYMCPDVWCPKSKLSYTMKQFKDRGNKCPQESETVINFHETRAKKQKKQTDESGNYVGFLSISKHPSRLCLPCCFTKEKGKAEDGCDDEKDIKGMRYIKGESAPVEVNRYGLLPRNLSNFLGNLTHTGGLMKKDMTMFLRHGITLQKHSFIHIMSQVLNNDKLKTQGDVLKSICDNIDMLDFLSLHNGDLFKKFISGIDHDLIYDKTHFTQFRGWFQGAQKYYTKFGLQLVQKHLVLNMTFNQKDKLARVVKREFAFWLAFKTFKDGYLLNDNIVKTHEFLLDLFNTPNAWLNVKGYNIIVLENDQSTGNVYIPCSINNKIRPLKDCILVIKSGQYYEPIHYLETQASAIDSVSRFSINQFPQIKKLTSYLSNSKTCKADIEHGDKLQDIVTTLISIDPVSKYILDYDFNIIALLLEKSKMIMPLPHKYALVGDGKQYTFLDAALLLPHSVKSDKAQDIVNKLYAAVNCKDHVFKVDTEVVIGEYIILKLKNTKTSGFDFIPLTNIDPDNKLLEEIDQDLNMMIRFEESDARLQLIEKNNVINALDKALWNEVVGFIKGNQDVQDKVAFLRNPLNPIPKAQRVAILHGYIATVNADVFKKPRPGRALDTFHNNMCSKISKIEGCDGQCSWFDVQVQGKIQKGKCKLVIPADIYSIIMGRVLIRVLDINVALRKSVIVDTQQGSNVLIFNDTDIKNGFLEKIFKNNQNVDEFGFKRVDKILSDEDFISANNSNVSQTSVFNIIGKTFKTIPTVIRPLFPTAQFDVNVFEKYDEMTLYHAFAYLYNVIHSDVQLDAETLFGMVNRMVVARLRNPAEYEATFASLLYNSSLEPLLKKYKKEDLEKTIQIVESKYHPSDLEINIIASICKINILIQGRKGGRNVENLWCLGKIGRDALYTCVLVQAKVKNVDVYNFIVRKKTRILFGSDELSPATNVAINKYCELKII